MTNFENPREFRARLARACGVTATVTTANRRGSWIGLSCGDHVCDRNDPRHSGRIEAIFSGGTARVKWHDTGWISDIDTDDVRTI